MGQKENSLNVGPIRKQNSPIRCVQNLQTMDAAFATRTMHSHRGSPASFENKIFTILPFNMNVDNSNFRV